MAKRKIKLKINVMLVAYMAEKTEARKKKNNSSKMKSSSLDMSDNGICS